MVPELNHSPEEVQCADLIAAMLLSLISDTRFLNIIRLSVVDLLSELI